jgi:hypothetical protein
MGGPDMAPIPPRSRRDRASGSIVLAVNPLLLPIAIRSIRGSIVLAPNPLPLPIVIVLAVVPMLRIAMILVVIPMVPVAVLPLQRRVTMSS